MIEQLLYPSKSSYKSYKRKEQILSNVVVADKSIWQLIVWLSFKPFPFYNLFLWWSTVDAPIQDVLSSIKVIKCG